MIGANIESYDQREPLTYTLMLRILVEQINIFCK